MIKLFLTMKFFDVRYHKITTAILIYLIQHVDFILVVLALRRTKKKILSQY